MNILEFLLNKLSTEKTAHDIAIRGGDLKKEERCFTRIQLLEELTEQIYKLENKQP